MGARAHVGRVVLDLVELRLAVILVGATVEAELAVAAAADGPHRAARLQGYDVGHVAGVEARVVGVAFMPLSPR